MKDVNFPVFLKLAKKQNRIFLSKNSSNWREMSATFTISDFDRFEFCPLFLKYTKLAKKQIFWWFLHKAEIGIELMTLCASCGTTMNVEMIHWKMNINSTALKKDALKPLLWWLYERGSFINWCHVFIVDICRWPACLRWQSTFLLDLWHSFTCR